eukprot:gene35687-46294_t
MELLCRSNGSILIRDLIRPLQQSYVRSAAQSFVGNSIQKAQRSHITGHVLLLIYMVKEIDWLPKTYQVVVRQELVYVIPALLLDVKGNRPSRTPPIPEIGYSFFVTVDRSSTCEQRLGLPNRANH